MAKTNAMPYNLEAEQSILGCILIDQLVQTEIIPVLKDFDFLVQSHKLIYDSILEVYNKNVPVDLVTLADVMQKNATLDKAGGIAYLTDLTRIVPSSANYAQYLDIVKRDGVLRRLINGSNKIIEDATNSLDSRKSLSYAEKTIFDISQENERHGLERLDLFVEPVIEKFERLEKDKNYSLGLKTHFERLDYMTNGFHKGNLIILAARPSIGKTTLAMNFVENCARYENAVCAVFALEMTKDELAQRMLCSVANVKMDEALKGKLTSTSPDAYKKLWDAKKILSKTKIFVDESSEVTPQDILTKCRRLKMRHGLDLVVVDHIQLMQSSKKHESRQQEVTEISRSLKMIAKELEVPVIALSQLSRQVTSRKGGKPVLSDLRESGAIEQDADLVLFIHRGDKDAMPGEAEKAVPNSAEIIIAKNRNGTCGEIPLKFKGEYVKFVQVTNLEEPGHGDRETRSSAATEEESYVDLEPVSDADVPSLDGNSDPLYGD